MSSLLGKALRTLVDIARLDERFNMRSQNRASILIIRRRGDSGLNILNTDSQTTYR